mgnify:CR=1 FL=1
MQRLGIEEPDEYVKPSFYRDADLAGERTGELLDLKDPPTCILYPDDYAAMGGINEIRERGLRIPEDISVAGYDGIEYRGYGQAIVEELAKYSSVPVWNGLTNEFHPTQMLADLLTIREHLVI